MNTNIEQTLPSTPIPIESEMKSSYLDYAMSVIISRALPDVRDGLKPVHRRVLFTMHEMGLDWNKAHKKSARIVGECFVKGALVHTETGLCPIETIETGQSVQLPNGALSRVTEVFHNPPGRVLDVKMANGLTLTVTPGQLFRVLNEDLTIGWEKAENLTERIVLTTNYAALGEPDAHPDADLSALAYLVGLFVAEGYLTDRGRSKRVGITMTDEEPLECLVTFCEKQQISASWSEIAPAKPHWKVRHCVRFTGIEQIYDACLETCEQKQVPAWILADRRLFAPFLAGYADGDGYFRYAKSRREVVFTSASAALLMQIQAMLADSGLHSIQTCEDFEDKAYGEGRLNRYNLLLIGDQASRFCALIRRYLQIGYKARAAEGIADWTSRTLNSMFASIPGRAIFAELSQAHLGGGWYQNRAGKKFRAGIKYPNGAKIRYEKGLLEKDLSYRQIEEWGILTKLETIGSPLAGRLKTLLTTYAVMRVEKVEDPGISVETYDLGIEDPEHEFLVHGLAVHNCMGKYHPHGDAAIYDTLVRMAQDFSLRYPLVDGQGNFGCFTGDTKIKLLDGTEQTFAELSELDPTEIFYVYAIDARGRIVVAEGRHARVTRRNAQLIEVTLDNGATVRCTPDHRFMLRDGTYRAAQDLTPNDSLMPGYFDTAAIKEGLNEYLRVLQPTTGEYEFVHHLADEFNAQKGLAPKFHGPYVRHHKNFKRWDNCPTNIERMEFLAHLHLHAAQIKELWEDNAFRQTQRQGVQRYYLENPSVLAERRQRLIAQNKSEAFRQTQSGRASQRLKKYYREHPAARTEISSRMKALWADPDYREKMSAALSDIEKRALTPAEKQRVAQIVSEKSRVMWADDEKRAEIIAAIIRAMSSAEIRRKLREIARQNWQDPAYRAKYPADHFSRMARTLWADPAMREGHRQKITRQRGERAFREAQRKAVQRTNAQRMAQNPAMMAQLAVKAAAALTEKWHDQNYQRRVMRKKIASYVARLLKELKRTEISPEVYEARRDANWIPSVEKALKYFEDFNELLDAAKHYNHSVTAIHWLNEYADVYDITVDEHHNFLLADGVFAHNSVDDDPPAAMRYTEARRARISDELLFDLEKETVNFVPNYDESLVEPEVLPAKLPNLLVNGSSGIAVGMATNIPPHNLSEVIDGLIALMDRPDMTIDELHAFIKGPDFPTGGIIYGRDGIVNAYHTGRGLIQVRARVFVEKEKRTEKERIIVTELPYQVNKAKLIEKMAELVREKRIEGISDLRDESDRDGMRIMIELKRDNPAEIVLNQLYKHTQLQVTFGANMMALVDQRPRLLTLKQMLVFFLQHRREVVTRRTQFLLRKAEARAHIVQGLVIALDHIDAVVQLIRASQTPQIAREGLMAQFALSDLQARAILDMRLQRLTGLEREKLDQEYHELLKEIAEYRDLLADAVLMAALIKKELLALKAAYGDARRTEIIADTSEITLEDMIVEEDMMVMITHGGYIKRNPVTLYRSQLRRGKGVTGIIAKEEDFVEHLFVASTHSYILVFTDKGKVYWLKVYEIPEAGRQAKGRAIVNLIRMEPGEKVSAILPVREFEPGKYLVMATQKGLVKKTELTEYDNPRANGIIALTIIEGDALVSVVLTDGKQDIFLSTSKGKSIRFAETKVRAVGRTAMGVRGIALNKSDHVIGMDVVHDEFTILMVTEKGYGKRSSVGDYRIQGRGGKGIITIKCTPKRGNVVGVLQVTDTDDILMITTAGKIIRMGVETIRVIGRNTQGMALQWLDSDDKVVAIARVVESEEEEIARGVVNA